VCLVTARYQEVAWRSSAASVVLCEVHVGGRQAANTILGMPAQPIQTKDTRFCRELDGQGSTGQSTASMAPDTRPGSDREKSVPAKFLSDHCSAI
jgi:hypothetical protein